MSDADRARKLVLAIEMNVDELACRMLEAFTGYDRPSGMAATQALAAMDQESRDDIRQAAIAALRYFEECVNAGQSVS